MTLSDPVRHQLVEGEIGEVIPAQLVQACATYGDNAAGSLGDFHQVSFGGRYQHRALEYAWAGACFQMPADRSFLGIRAGDGRNVWQFGFVTPPALESRSVGTDGSREWWLTWKVPPGVFAHASYGAALTGSSSGLTRRFLINADTKSGAGELRVGLQQVDVEGQPQEDPYLEILERIFLMVHR